VHVLDSGRRRTRAGTLALALGACLCAGQLIAAAPTGAVEAATATATTTTVPAAFTPRVTMAANRYAIGWGQSTLVVGAQVRDGVRVLNPAASRYIRVTVRPSGAQVVSVARSLTGRPYRWGAAGPRAFDCSGFTQYVLRKVTKTKLPHKANAQQRYGKRIPRSQARPGDLIFFRSGSYAYHVGIYAGNGYMYDAPRPGKRVGKHKIWSRNYVVRRLV
jgi:cell wall-associated NlpC family hydrolase